MDKLKEWIEPVLSKLGCRLYDIEWIPSQDPPLLRFSVEKENGGMDLDTCALCSDAIGEVLDQKTGLLPSICWKYVLRERKGN